MEGRHCEWEQQSGAHSGGDRQCFRKVGARWHCVATANVVEVGIDALKASLGNSMVGRRRHGTDAIAWSMDTSKPGLEW